MVLGGALGGSFWARPGARKAKLMAKNLLKLTYLGLNKNQLAKNRKQTTQDQCNFEMFKDGNTNDPRYCAFPPPAFLGPF